LKIPLNLPFEKGEIKTKIFLIPLFFQRGAGGDFCKKEKQKNKSPCFPL